MKAQSPIYPYKDNSDTVWRRSVSGYLCSLCKKSEKRLASALSQEGLREGGTTRCYDDGPGLFRRDTAARLEK